LTFGYRVVAGVGVGMASVAVPLYISENAPRAIRGALTGLYQLSIVLGIMVSFWIDYASLLHISGNATWIVPIALQALPAVLLFFGMLFCNETPRHLAKQNDWDNAKATLAKVRSLPQSHPYVETEFGVIRAQLERERILGRGSTFMAMQKEMWKIPGNRKRVLISISLMIAQQMTGVNALNYYAPKIFQGLGLRDLNVSLFATGIYGVVKVVGCTCFLVFAADSLGRRRSLLWTAICQAAVMFYIGLYVRIHPQVNGERLPAAGYVALVCIYLFAAIYQFGWGPVPWIYIAEIPTMRLRSLNVAIGACTQWLFNFVVARSTPNMLATLGPGGYGTYLVFGSLSVFMFIFTWFFVPETKGMFIEEMDDLFGVLELAKRMLEEAELENGGPLRSSTYTDPGDLASCRSHPAKGNSSMRFKKCLMRNQMVEWITNIFSRILGSKSLRGKDHQEAFRKLCRQTFSTTTAGGSFSTASFAPIRHPAACGRLARKMSKENRSAANSYLLLV
jgi:sugar porter (SP) family MFS transporter